METIGSTYKKIEVLANVMTIVVAALISVALVKAYFIPAPPAVTARTMSGEAGVGTSLKGRLPDVDWGRIERTLLVAISTQCHFCKESTPFYRKLQEQIGKRLKIVAVLPQPTTAAEQFLSNEGIHFDAVKQITLGEIGVRGTPTMLLVDRSGVVTKMWTGKLQPDQEERVLTYLKKG